MPSSIYSLIDFFAFLELRLGPQGLEEIFPRARRVSLPGPPLIRRGRKEALMRAKVCDLAFLSILPESAAVRDLSVCGDGGQRPGLGKRHGLDHGPMRGVKP
jgi:hypothetical protein